MNNVTRNCQQDFTIEPEDFNFYEKIKVPSPTFCPECRLVRRLNWQGYRILYKRKCDFTGDMIFSTYHPDSPYKVYRQDIWWGDKWDPKSYGKDIDWKKPFLEQFKELMLEVPHVSLATVHSTMVRSDYCNAAGRCKDCYLCFRITGGEDSAYLNTIVDGKQSLDCSFLNHSELCYESVNINKCYQVFFSQDCTECQSVWFSRDLVGCSDCVGCINLRMKKYCIFNKQYNKEEYQKKFREFDFGTPESIQSFEIQAYEKLIPKIKEHMKKVLYIDRLGRKYFYGEMLPAEFSPWAYNESTSYECLPLTKEDAEGQGLKWRDPDLREYKDATMEIPEHIRDVPDDILKAILKCSNCGKNY